MNLPSSGPAARIVQEPSDTTASIPSGPHQRHRRDRLGCRHPRSRPVLPAGAGSCRGSSLSGVCPERSGGTRRPQAVAPLTGSFRGDRIARHGKTARSLRQARPTGVCDGGDRLAASAGERRCGGGPRRASPTLRQRAWAAAQQRRDSPADLSPPTAGILACPTLPLGGAARSRNPAGAGRPGAPKACHLSRRESCHRAWHKSCVLRRLTCDQSSAR